MNYFDLTKEQKAGFINMDKTGITLSDYLRTVEAYAPGFTPTRGDILAIIGQNRPEPGQNAGKTKKAAKVIKNQIKAVDAPKKAKTHYSEINDPNYFPPANSAYYLMQLCRCTFARCNKAANSLSKNGWYVSARSFKDGGGYDIYTVIGEGNETDLNVYAKNVHPRKVESVLNEIIKGRYPKN